MCKVLVTGGNGQLGQCLRKIDEKLNKGKFIFKSHSDLDITNYNALKKYCSENNLDYIINCAAYTNVDKAEDEYSKAYNINCEGVKNLVEVCKEYNIRLIHISTDYVFDGKNNKPYKPNDRTEPKSNYGGTKELGESAIKISKIDYMIIRTSWLYSRFGNNFVTKMLSLFKDKKEIKVVCDQMGSPTNAEDLALFIFEVILENKFKNGIYHFCNTGVASWYDFAMEIKELSNSDIIIYPCSSEEFPTKAKRPHYSVLDCSDIYNIENGAIPYWRDSLKKTVYALCEKNND